MDCDSERIWKIVENQRHNVPRKKRAPGVSLSLSDRLYDWYVECVQRQNDKTFDKRFRNTCNLLQQLPAGHVTPSLVVNLYSDDRGYSLIIDPENEREEIFLPYENDEIFSYLDNQEIPPVMIEVLADSDLCHMYGGCLVCEVRNHRNSASSSAPSSYDSHLLLLRPTAESILQMVKQIADNTGCSLEDQLALESRLLLATQPPICLDPSTEVVWVTNRLHYNRNKFRSLSMRRYLRRHSQARRSRMYQSSLRPAPPELRLHNFLTASGTPLKSSRSKYTDGWKRKPLAHLPTSTLNSISRKVQEFATVPPEPPPTPTTPTLDHTSSVTTPFSHPHTPGQFWAEDLLHLESRGTPTPVVTPTTTRVVAGVAPPVSIAPPLPPPAAAAHTPPPLAPPPTVHMPPLAPPPLAPPPPLHTPPLAPPPPLHTPPLAPPPLHTPPLVPPPLHTPPLAPPPLHTPPIPKTTPTVQPIPAPPLPAPAPLPATPQKKATTRPTKSPSLPLTISIPRQLLALRKTTPTGHTHKKTNKTPLHPQPPNSLPVISGSTRKPPSYPTIFTPPVSMATGRKSITTPVMSSRSLAGVITPGNRRPVTTTTQVGGVVRRSIGHLTPPKLQRLTSLPPLSSSHPPVSLAMPKLHRLTTPTTHHSLSLSSTSKISSKATPLMPTLRPLAIENGLPHLISVPKTLPKLNRL